MSYSACSLQLEIGDQVEVAHLLLDELRRDGPVVAVQHEVFRFSGEKFERITYDELWARVAQYSGAQCRDLTRLQITAEYIDAVVKLARALMRTAWATRDMLDEPRALLARLERQQGAR